MGLNVREQRQRLAWATARRDASALRDDVVRRAAVQWPQQGGELLLGLTADERAAAAELLVQVMAALRERDWPGDDVLVDQLDGRRAALAQVDLDQLASALDGHEGGLLDLANGMTLPADVVEDAGLDVDESVAVDVPGLGPREAWRDRRSFVETLPDGAVRDGLTAALDGGGAFRRFARELDRHEELVAPFLAWRDERAAGRARAWLRDQRLLDPH